MASRGREKRSSHSGHLNIACRCWRWWTRLSLERQRSAHPAGENGYAAAGAFLLGHQRLKLIVAALLHFMTKKLRYAR
jgi:hypothetical protein